MKFLITLLSSLVVGVALAASGFSPLHEIRHLLRNKRKIFAAVGLMAVGFVFGMAGVLVALIEGALQLDAQGFLMWSALFSLSLILVVASGISFIIARKINPMTTMAADMSHSLLADLDTQFNLAQIVQQWNDGRRREERRGEVPRSEYTADKFASVEPQSSFHEVGREGYRH